MLKIENLSFSYGEVRALRRVNLEVPQKKIVCVMGRNGVGKTTLMRNIIGLERPYEGSVLFEGADLTKRPPYKRIRSGLGYVPQGRMIFPKLTVEENLKVGLTARDDGLQDIPEETYALFPVLKEMTMRMGGDLSGGQQQQLAIARALVTKPKLLILDEPTEGIQPNVIAEIGSVLHHLVDKRNLTILVVEQYLDFVREFSQKFYVMNRGGIVAEGATGNLTEEIVKNYLSV